jgi:4-alpha-glucanotransferase
VTDSRKRTLGPLRSLAKAAGVLTRYKDGLGRQVEVQPDTLVRVCAALGAPVTGPDDAGEALKALRAGRRAEVLPPVIVAWNGALPALQAPYGGRAQALLQLEDGGSLPVTMQHGLLAVEGMLPLGYHRLTIDAAGRLSAATVISAPVETWRRPGEHRSWGLGTQLAALRSRRSRTFGDLRDLETLCGWVRERGGDLVTALPLLPTFNDAPAEPSPYSPVSRLFWSELMLDLGDAHRPTAAADRLDVTAADAEVRAALAGVPAPDLAHVDDELLRYARFRGSQARLGRNWRAWPLLARSGTLAPEHLDAGAVRFHLAAQIMARQQLRALRSRLDAAGVRLGLDLAVGVHPDGFDPWSRQHLFAEGMSVGAPPDAGFPSGQDWGFTPVLPAASRHEGHRYIAASIGHQASLAGVLRIDHIMAWTRLYWIPHGMGLHQGTYVTYPAEELFAVLALESNRHRCEVVGENLGTVPKDIHDALPRHRIRGMYLAQFEAPCGPRLHGPAAHDMALIGTHDTPTFAGWTLGHDIGERVRYRLLNADAEADERQARRQAVEWLAHKVKASPDDPADFLARLLDWLGASDSPLVVPWLEDLWLEATAVNLPGTPSHVRPNWQRPMSRLLDDALGDAGVDALVRRLAAARRRAP